MPDPVYSVANLILRSRGVIARYADDQPPAGEGYYLNEDNLEEIEENALASRLGTTILNKSGGTAYPLGAAGAVHSLSKLASLSGSDFRYAGTDDEVYRLFGEAPGIYQLIASGLSGKPWTSAVFQSPASSLPYLFIADKAKMLKDNGYLSAPQNNGIKQPQVPIQAAAGQPSLVTLDNFTSSAGYTYGGISAGSLVPVVSCFTNSAVAFLGVQEISVTVIQQIGLFQLLTIDTAGSQEVVLVLEVTKTGFVANFTKTHLSGVAVGSEALDMSVPASTSGSVSRSFGGTPIAAWPTTLEQEDYIGLYIRVSDPVQIDSITLKFDCGDGTFTHDFFWRTIGQGPSQSALDPSTDSSTAAADAILSNSLGLFALGAGGVSPLSTGQSVWTPLLMQLSDFSGTGRADFNSPNFSWNQVNGYRVDFTTNANGVGATIELAALIVFGGAGPDSLAGVAYDYLFTFFNINDYTESNPCMVMTNVDPPLNTNWVLPRRQPVVLTITNNAAAQADPQSTHLRIYRRGGTLADNYRRIDQVPLTALPNAKQTYTDLWSDLEIQQSDTVSFTNDVPVTSTLPVPVNTTLNTAIVTTNQAVGVHVTSLANISVGQQVSIGNVTAKNFETVIVTGITPGLGLFGAFVQNNHDAGEPVAATAAYAVPVDIIAVAYDQGWYAGDVNNPSFLYYSAKGNIQAVSSAAYVPVSVPSDAVTAIVNSRGNLFVSTQERWWAIAPGSQVGGSPTVYPTAADKGCVGKLAWCLREGIAYFIAVDGPRIFTGGASQLISEVVQFVWQGIGTTPIPVADPAYFYNARVAYWNQFVFFAYRGLDGLQHRLILDVEQKRWRNDEVGAQSMFLEQDTNLLQFGDSYGLVHLDRQNVGYDEAAGPANAVVQNPIAITLQTPYGDQSHPEAQKLYQEFTGDFDTNGVPVTATLLLNDGQSSQVLGTITTAQRQRVNLNVNGGAGIQAYKASLQLTGAGTQRILLYQAKLKYLDLAITRQSLDTYWCRFSDDSSKVAKNLFIEYNAASAITGNIYYDGLATPGFTFTLPQYNGVRNAIRVRLPAVKFRLARLILTAATPGADFQVWNESRWEVKSVCQGKGYAFFPLVA